MMNWIFCDKKHKNLSGAPLIRHYRFICLLLIITILLVQMSKEPLFLRDTYDTNSNSFSKLWNYKNRFTVQIKCNQYYYIVSYKVISNFMCIDKTTVKLQLISSDFGLKISWHLSRRNMFQVWKVQSFHFDANQSTWKFLSTKQ